MRTPVAASHSRRVLCVFPRYVPSFGTFQHAYPLMDGVRAFMPPQGILVFAAKELPAEIAAFKPGLLIPSDLKSHEDIVRA